MVRKEERIFDGRKFTVYKLPASEAILLKMELIHLLGGALGGLAELFEGKEKESDDLNLKKLGDGLGSIFKDIDPRKVTNLIQQICGYCFVDGKKQSFDEMFAKAPLTSVYKVVGWVLEVNFSDFFGGKGLLSLAEGKIQKKEETLKR